jgi:hypothetical protein
LKSVLFCDCRAERGGSIPMTAGMHESQQAACRAFERHQYIRPAVSSTVCACSHGTQFSARWLAVVAPAAAFSSKRCGKVGYSSVVCECRIHVLHMLLQHYIATCRS